LPPTTHSKPFDDLEHNSWSNKFEVTQNDRIDLILNDGLRSLINTKTLQYGTKVKYFSRKLKSKKYCTYQSKLLSNYLTRPEENLTLDCDRLTITIDCTAKDIKVFEDKEKVRKTSVKATGQILTISRCGVGKVNGGKKGPERPFYTSAYRFNLYDDPRRFLMLHVANGQHHKHKKTALRIDFIPNRFNDTEIQILFGHLRYLLTYRRYEQLMKKAKVTRVDIGFNLPGVMSSFVYICCHIIDTALRASVCQLYSPKA
jgi:hypothetical protein